jgi:hypothetical protein
MDEGTIKTYHSDKEEKLLEDTRACKRELEKIEGEKWKA